MPVDRYAGPFKVLEELVLELEELRRRVPEAIYEGSAEEVLEDAYSILQSIIPQGVGVVYRPFTGLNERIRLLGQLAAALRLRMTRVGTPYISGTDYFIDKLDDIIAEIRWMAGFNPNLPLGYTGKYRARS